ncbi:hypothetical protein QBC45DRAFT_145705 [Copromyces sp. CBS 386.78]|nr:hypothetical protein QBC45DRAFT_145705 [Copromyces sp. CBS 386.78]
MPSTAASTKVPQTTMNFNGYCVVINLPTNHQSHSLRTTGESVSRLSTSDQQPSFPLSLSEKLNSRSATTATSPRKFLVSAFMVALCTMGAQPLDNTRAVRIFP